MYIYMCVYITSAFKVTDLADLPFVVLTVIV